MIVVAFFVGKYSMGFSRRFKLKVHGAVVDTQFSVLASTRTSAYCELTQDEIGLKFP